LISVRSLDGAKFCAGVVDDYFDYCWSLKTKIINLLSDLRIFDIKVEFICFDHPGENRSMKDDFDVKKLESNLSSQNLGHPRETAKLRESFKLLWQDSFNIKWCWFE
jgi:hypothetical protein